MCVSVSDIVLLIHDPILKNQSVANSVSSNFSILIGFAIWPFMLLSNALALSSLNAFAVMARIGVFVRFSFGNQVCGKPVILLLKDSKRNRRLLQKMMHLRRKQRLIILFIHFLPR